jgi:NAD(P)-dependent dehydrogenase (short-subunit alcohol dehydrogenase family)
MRFRDKVALVAGGTGALGRSVSLAFLSEGARVIVLGRDSASFAALADAASEHRDRLTFTEVDLARSPEGERAVNDAVRAEGRLDAVVNTVGGWGGGVRLGEEPPDLLERMLTMNLRTGYALARAAIPLLVSQKGGAFVEVGSRAAIGPQPRQASYAASKAAALSLFLSLAEEVKRDGVRVNVVLPATLDTEANRRAMPGADRSTWVSTEDVAWAILFLCSEDAGAVTGAAIPVYGRA